MEKYIFLQPDHWCKSKNYFLKPNFLISVILIFSSLQTADGTTHEKLIQNVDPMISQLLASQYDCSKQYSLKKVSLSQVQERYQAHSEIDFSGPFGSVFTRVKTKRYGAFRCTAKIQKNRVSCAQGLHNKDYRHDHMQWHNNSMPYLKYYIRKF